MRAISFRRALYGASRTSYKTRRWAGLFPMYECEREAPPIHVNTRRNDNNPREADASGTEHQSVIFVTQHDCVEMNSFARRHFMSINTFLST